MSAVCTLNEWSSMVKLPAILCVTYESTPAIGGFVCSAKVVAGLNADDTWSVSVDGPARSSKAAAKETAARILISELPRSFPHSKKDKSWRVPQDLVSYLTALQASGPPDAIGQLLGKLIVAVADHSRGGSFEDSRAAELSALLPTAARMNLVSSFADFSLSTRDD